MPDGIWIFLFVNPDQPAFLLHSDIAGHFFVIANNGQLGVQALKFRYRFGHEIMMCHRGHGQLQPRPFAHLTGICAACIHHMFADDRAFFCLDFPVTRRLLRNVCGAAVSDDFYALLPRARGHGHRHIGWVNMAVIWRMQRAQNPVEIVKRVQLRNFFWANQVDVEPQRPPDRQGVAQPIHFVFGIGQAERPAAVPCYGLTRFCLKPAGIEANVVIDAFSQSKVGC